ncbi:hypothetical protein LY16_02084 [Xenorhabdus doucetiae]|uniref:Uncharacterized protein n=1 Tax=Xenorhabdus doucetiae TaxID=351671 RepID=A0ABY3NR76_9GAMM|nr:hypothetical protein LY16_02084 [Xenorhabdus doucetiae]
MFWLFFTIIIPSIIAFFAFSYCANDNDDIKRQKNNPTSPSCRELY